MKLISKGAEAELYLINWFGIKAIRKIRTSKSYRIFRLDNQLRVFRTLNEARLLINVKKIGIPVPTVFDVDVNEYSIIMEYIDGILLRDMIPQLNLDKLSEIFMLLGMFIGKLHDKGFYHGDLTTSNVFLVNNNLVLIDFGLGGVSHEFEAFGVDIHLMLRALESTHHDIAPYCFSQFRDGYSTSFCDWEIVFNKVEDIRKRGRYVIERRVRTK